MPACAPKVGALSTKRHFPRAHLGTGDRSEKIRTYNFPQDRCTDHRIGLTVHNLSKIMDGGLDEVLDALILHEQAEKLSRLSQ